LFWGKFIGTSKDYYIVMGVKYTGKYEFPVKIFYWASSVDFNFKIFEALNDQHKNHYDKIKSLITGDAKLVHVKVEPEKVEGEEEN
jgi:radial spoke head protein 9